MCEPVDSNAIERTFQDIPDSDATEEQQIALLMDLGWHKGSDWDDLLKSKRVLIISEAGAGKTYECREQRKALWEAGEPAFYVELADLAKTNVRDLLSHEEAQRFDAWLSSQSDIATFFLDSIDELNLSLGSFERALKNLERAVAGQLHRIRVVITSRPIPVDQQLFRDILPVPPQTEGKAAGGEKEFADVAMSRRRGQSNKETDPKLWRNVALLPLSMDQIRQMAINEGVTDPDALLADIRQRNAEEFARRPQDLIELCTDWRDHRRIRSHRQQVASNVAVKLKPRENGAESAQLSPDKALQGARRLALAATLSRKLTLRYSANADRAGDASEVPLDPSKILLDWTPEERSTLLERALFGFASYGRVRFHHRSVIEYLAAEHLSELRDRGMSLKALKRLLFTTTAQGDEVVKPSVRPVAAWLALRDDAIFDEVLRREPDVLLNHGDPESLTPAQRQRALRAYVERYGHGGWRGLRVPPIQLHRFACADLAPEVSRLWAAGIENPDVRELLLNLIELGSMTDCADIAHEVAVDGAASHSERIDALDALIHLNDPRLAGIGETVAEDETLWPNRLARSALVRLFPAHLSVDLMGKGLSRISESKRAVGEITWALPRAVMECALTPVTSDQFREKLTDLAVDGIAWNKDDWPHLASRRQFLLPALAAVCLRQMQSGITTPELMRSVTIALRLADREFDHTEHAKALESALATAPSNVRRAVFEAGDAFMQHHHPCEEAFERYAQTVLRGAFDLELADRAWVLEMLADRSRQPAERAMLLEIAIRIREQAVTWHGHLAWLDQFVSDLPDLSERLRQLAKPTKRDREHERMERSIEKRRKQSELRDKKAHASWVLFWREIANEPDKAFSPEKSGNTTWNLWQAMERSGEESRGSGWNRRFIEQHFGKPVADQMRTALRDVWRNDKPTLRSERSAGEKGTYYTRWQLGLAAIAAEAEDTSWASKLSEDEAKLALRYAPIELNGFPAWLESLAEAHPNAVEEVLGGELTAELAEPAVAHSSTLQNIRHASSAVAAIFVPRLRTWLDGKSWRKGNDDEEAPRIYRLRQVVEILLQHDDGATVEQVKGVAKAELKRKAITPALAGMWLSMLLRLDPVGGVGALEKALKPHAPSKFGTPTNWFSALFGDHHDGDAVRLTGHDFTPELLLRLSRLAYQYLRPKDDMVRDEGSYSPNARDHAERGRSNILNAILSTKGAEGWAIKIKLANDPLFAHFRERALTLAKERAAEEADAIPYAESDIVALDQQGELPPLTRDEMFMLMVDRLDDLDDTQLRDDSPRSAWALINDEKIMRKQIARELRSSSRRAYNVDQEATTADEKETDIRLRSTGSEHEAVIELKIGEKNRSASDLRDTLEEQLVVKYMAPDNCRVGCLLITSATGRTWNHPTTNATLDLAGLIAFLNEEAAKIENEMGGSVRLIARGLDLTPRLPTESAKRARNKQPAARAKANTASSRKARK
jgi:hypothetical protein